MTYIKKIKYLFIVLFIFIIYLVTAEMYAAEVETFESKYMLTTMVKSKNISSIEMIKDVKKEARKDNLLAFFVNNNTESASYNKKTVYTMDGGEYILNNENYIKEGSSKSLFLGNTYLEYKNIEQAVDVINDNKDIDLYLIGDINKARDFKSRLIDKYYGNFPHEGYTSFDGRKNLVFIWISCIIFFILLTIFDISLLKKEIVVRVINGDSINRIVAKNILNDTGVIILASIISKYTLKYIFGFNTFYQSKVSNTLLILYCILNSVSYLILYRFNLRKHLSTSNGSFAVLNLTYIFKVTIIILLSSVLTVSIDLINKSLSYFNEESFFKDNKNLNYLTINMDTDDIEDTEKITVDIANKKSNENNLYLNTYIGQSPTSNKPMLLFNYKRIDYLKENIKDLSEVNFSKDYYFLIPYKYKDNANEEISILKDSLGLDKNISNDTIFYKDNTKLIGINQTNEISSDFYKNPIVIINNTINNNYNAPLSFLRLGMYDMGKKDLTRLFEEDKVDRENTYLTNVYNNYLQNKSKYERIALLGCAIFISLIILDIIVSQSLIKFDFSVNSTQLAIESTLGYTIFEKYKNIFLVDIISLLISLAISVIISHRAFNSNLVYTIVAVLIFSICDLLTLLLYIKRNESRNIQKILKGQTI